METHVVYCSACDREVKVAFRHTPGDPGPAGREVDTEGICMDYSAKACTGSLCALFDLPPTEMLARLREAGM